MDAKYGCNVERPAVQSRLVNGRVRHTWASWHVQNGTPLFAQQEPGGWESAEMVRRYAHLAAEPVTGVAFDDDPSAAHGEANATTDGAVDDD